MEKVSVARIQELLILKPGLKAQQIAAELGIERSVVASTLHGVPDILQDNAYRWWPKVPEASVAAEPIPRTFLSRLCRYYLESLSRESGSGFSLPAAALGTEYVELQELPFSRPESLTKGPETRKLIQKVRRDRGQLSLYIGYAIRVRSASSEHGGALRLEPVLLYPLDESPDPIRLQTGSAPPAPASGIPLFNLEVLKSLPAVATGNAMDEAIQLSEDLGLSNEDDVPPWDEIILRLQHCRPEWEWRESLNPHTLSRGPALAELREPGIYNRAMLFTGTRSPFTFGLETELRKLALLEEDDFKDTALGQWLSGKDFPHVLPEDRPLLEVLPLNAEQRQAVLMGLSAPLTVVTGPPGTGKSQVVTSLLVNTAWQGASILFASKNNHAVDVVETRVNGLGPDPLLFRLGREEHQERLAQYLTSSLAESNAPGDAGRLARLAQAHGEDCEAFAAVQRRIVDAVALRNSVDALERAAEPARSLLGAERFARIRTGLDADGIRGRLEALAAALDAAREANQHALVRLVWDTVKARRFRSAAELAAALEPDAELLGVALQKGYPNALTLDLWDELLHTLAERLAVAIRVRAYWLEYEKLRSAESLRDLGAELANIARRSSHTSLELWQLHLRQWPGRWSSEQRRLLSEFVALLQIMAGGGRYDEGAGRKVFHRYYSLFPKVTKLLPCWAVTSLSARGRLPFVAGLFDLVVIDEASQCDIASALPLLFRARRAVIIGDPLQLKHVSTVGPQQDRLVLGAHGLAEGRAAWAYSVNSLFDLARSVCGQGDIVNLRDHHRSHRDIIAFSNLHFYRGGLRIATDHGALKRSRTGPATRWIDVRGKVTRPSGGGAMNGMEAEAVIAELSKLLLETGGEHEPSIGIVTPFRGQANRIRTLLHQDEAISGRLSALRLIVDTVHGFQGDERDIIFFSPVVSRGTSENTMRFLKSQGNLFNVAVTRARADLIVVGDRQAALDSGVPYLAAFAEYSRNLETLETGRRPTAELGPEYPAVAQPELVSEWERIFYRAAYAAGLRLIPQYEEAPFTLDFALFEGERYLDIEIDGENYHRDWDGALCRKDQIRSRRLSEAGWDSMRFWIYEIRDDLGNCIDRVKAWVRDHARR